MLIIRSTTTFGKGFYLAIIRFVVLIWTRCPNTPCLPSAPQETQKLLDNNPFFRGLVFHFGMLPDCVGIGASALQCGKNQYLSAKVLAIPTLITVTSGMERASISNVLRIKRGNEEETQNTQLIIHKVSRTFCPDTTSN